VTPWTAKNHTTVEATDSSDNPNFSFLLKIKIEKRTKEI
jgi:hypothetical protein